MESGENSSQNPGQFSQEVKLMGPVHPVVAVLMEQEKKIKGLINRVSGGELLIKEEERANANSQIWASKEYLSVVEGIIGQSAFNLGEVDVVGIGRYLDDKFPRTDSGAVTGVTANTVLRKNLLSVIGVVYCMKGVKGISDERLKSFIQMSPGKIMREPEIVGNREVLTEIVGRAGPVDKLVNLWNKESVRKDIMTRYGVSERFFTITGDFGNGFNLIDLNASLALRILSPAAPA